MKKSKSKADQTGENVDEQVVFERAEVKVDAPKVVKVTPQPSIGRIVIYNNGDVVLGDKQLPAIVTRVNEDGSCRLYVFGARGKTFEAGNATQGSEMGQWDWPVRV